MKINAAEDTPFKVKKTLNCRGKILDLSTPAIMAVMNITPDSFYSDSRINDENSALIHAEKLLQEGADIIDIGGQSTRPGAVRISAEEEWNRIGKIISVIHEKFPDAIISVDTFYSAVAAKALSNGASIINDISAGEFDPVMLDLISEKNVPYITMHMQGQPQNMQINPHYENVLSEVMNFFIDKIHKLRENNIHDIIIDPGFGFGKSVEHNYTLLCNLHIFKILNLPILAGLSRKSMITKALGIKFSEALNATTSLNTIALMNGANILRVHDVKEAGQVRQLIKHLNNNSASDKPE